MTSETDTIRVIVFQDADYWVAQCLEYDIGAQADDVDTLMARLEVALKAEFNESMERHGKAFEGIEAAPQRFQSMWERRARSVAMTPPPWMTAAARPMTLGLVA
jgi:hypothetical protein